MGSRQQIGSGKEESQPGILASGSPAEFRVTFAVVAGPHQGQVFHFEGHDTFIVGRSQAATFRLPQKDEYFSRVHFLVEMNPPRCRLMDMGSTNGTLVNGQRVMIIDLKDGDLIQGGQTSLRVSIVGSDKERETKVLPALVEAAADGQAMESSWSTHYPTTTPPIPRNCELGIPPILFGTIFADGPTLEIFWLSHTVWHESSCTFSMVADGPVCRPF